jgi:hypothetical protein
MIWPNSNSKRHAGQLHAGTGTFRRILQAIISRR